MKVETGGGVRDRRLHAAGGHPRATSAPSCSARTAGRICATSAAWAPASRRRRSRTLHRGFQPLGAQDAAVRGPAAIKGATWLAPRLVAQVAFHEWTEEGKLRQPVFLGLRDDKKSERGPAAEAVRSEPARRKRRGRPARRAAPDLQPRQGLLAGGGVHEARPHALLQRGLPEAPALREGPPALAGALPGRNGGRVLLPEGEAAEHAPGHSDPADPAREGDDQLRRRGASSSRSSPWSTWAASRSTSGGRASRTRASPTGCASTWIPTRGSSPTRRTPGSRLKEALDALDLVVLSEDLRARRGCTSSCRSETGPDADEVRGFAETLGHRLAQAYPKEMTMESRIAARRGRVYLDPFRNGFAQTVVSPYCVRRAAKAPVSTPLAWSEVRPTLNPSDVQPGQLRRAPGEEGSVGGLLREPPATGARPAGGQERLTAAPVHSGVHRSAASTSSTRYTRSTVNQPLWSSALCARNARF